MTFLNEKDKNPEEESLTSFGNSFDCSDINQIEKALLDECYANLIRGIDNTKRLSVRFESAFGETIEIWLKSLQ